MMLIKALIAVVLSSVAAISNADDCTSNLQANTPISVVGSFSNISYSGEHAIGYTAELWRSSNCYFGILFSYYGLNGDSPAGLIENIKYDKNSGAISFSARLTMGKVSETEPSKDIYEFTGVLKQRSLNGIMLHKLLNYPDSSPVSEEVILNPSSRDQRWMPYFPTYSTWEAATKVLLSYRGPKW